MRSGTRRRERPVGAQIRWFDGHGLEVRVAVEAEEADGLFGVVEQDQGHGVGSGGAEGDGLADRSGELRQGGALQEAQHLDELAGPPVAMIGFEAPAQGGEALGQLPVLQRPGEVDGAGLALQEGQVVDRLYNQLCSEVSLPSRGAWQDRLRALATSIRSVFSAHRDSARIAVGRFPLGPHGLQVTEVALAALADAGLDVEDTAHAAHLFFSYVTSFSYQETVLPASTPTGDRAASLALVEHYLSSLPPDDFPHVTRCAQALSRPGLDRRFTFGLDRLIRGLTPS